MCHEVRLAPSLTAANRSPARLVMPGSSRFRHRFGHPPARSGAGHVALLRGHDVLPPVVRLLSVALPLSRPAGFLVSDSRCHRRCVTGEAFELCPFLAGLVCCAVRATPNIALQLAPLAPRLAGPSRWRPQVLPDLNRDRLPAILPTHCRICRAAAERSPVGRSPGGFG
jgi:hypothetical protein